MKSPVAKGSSREENSGDNWQSAHRLMMTQGSQSLYRAEMALITKMQAAKCRAKLGRAE